jgi:hypothetical protein
MEPWHIIHILGFITPYFIPISLMIIVVLITFEACVWVGMGMGKFLFVYVLKTFLPRKYIFWMHGCIWLAVCFNEYL